MINNNGTMYYILRINSFSETCVLQSAIWSQHKLLHKEKILVRDK